MHLNSELEESDELQKFIWLLKRHNNDKAINQDFVDKLERFFYYKW